MAVFFPPNAFETADAVGNVLALFRARPSTEPRHTPVATWRLDAAGRLVRIWRLESSRPPS